MLIGNVGKDPEIRYLDQNSPNNANAKVASFPLATSERYRDRNGEQHENTEWHNIVAWRSLADLLEKYVKKGTQIYIEGKLRTRSWTDQTGNKRFTTEVVADTIQLLGKKSDNPANNENSGGGYSSPYQNYSTPANQPQYAAPAQQVSPEQDPSDSDDLPF